MSFSILHITPSRFDLAFEGERYTMHGEALDSEVGGLDYVIYGTDFHFTDDSGGDRPIPEATRLAVLENLKLELIRRGWVFEVDGDSTRFGTPAVAPGLASVGSGGQCPQSGYWFTPSRLNSRRHFVSGEIMPDVGGSCGATIWRWDEQQ
jgi:hypothetical protein